MLRYFLVIYGHKLPLELLYLSFNHLVIVLDGAFAQSSKTSKTFGLHCKGTFVLSCAIMQLQKPIQII